MNRESHRRQRGVALIEVMIAAAVIGIGMGVAFRALSATLRQESILERRGTAARLAEKTLTEMRLTNRLSQPGRQAGNCEAPFEDYAWRVEVAPDGPENAQLRVQIDIENTQQDVTLYRLDTWVFGGGE